MLYCQHKQCIQLLSRAVIAFARWFHVPLDLYSNTTITCMRPKNQSIMSNISIIWLLRRFCVAHNVLWLYTVYLEMIPSRYHHYYSAVHSNSSSSGSDRVSCQLPESLCVVLVPRLHPGGGSEWKATNSPLFGILGLDYSVCFYRCNRDDIK